MQPTINELKRRGCLGSLTESCIGWLASHASQSLIVDVEFHCGNNSRLLSFTSIQIVSNLNILLSLIPLEWRLQLWI